MIITLSSSWGTIAAAVLALRRSPMKACSLTNFELQERRRNVLQNVTSAIIDLQELDDGYLYHFPSDAMWISELASLVGLERQCCSFLRFRLTV